jgi:ABC-type bacteriocin/lantibiotic exporter with double-glycine peptidase domain
MRLARWRVATPDVRQAEAAECGLAALAIILGYHGTHVSLEELRGLAGSSARGTSAFFLVTLARRFGLSVSVSRAEPEALARLGFPLIAHMRFIHFVVVEGMHDGRVRLNDPNGGPRVVSAEEFDGDFTGVVLRFTPGPGHLGRGRPLCWWHPVVERARRHRLIFSVSAAAAVAAGAAALAAIKLMAGAFGDAAGGMGLRAIAFIAAALLAAILFEWLRDVAAARLSGNLAADAVFSNFRILAGLPARFCLDRQPSQLRAKLGAAVVLGSQDELVSSTLGLASPAVFAAGAVAIDAGGGGAIALTAVLEVCLVVLLFSQRGSANARLGNGGPSNLPLSPEQVVGIDSYWVGTGQGDLFTTLAGRHARLFAPLHQAGTRYALLQAIRGFLSTVRLVGAVGFGLLGVVSGVLTFGAAAMLAILAVLVDAPLGRFARCFRLAPLKEASIAIKDLEGVAVETTEPAAARLRPGMSIEAIDVTWSAGSGQPSVMSGLSFAVEPGRQLGISGPSGSGKTILTQLLTGLRPATAGTLLIEARPPRAWRAGDAALVTRVSTIFAATVRENLSLGASVTDHAVAAALHEVRLWEELAPRGGLDLRLSEGGPELSGGQRNRLDIARALLRRPGLLVLDGALDSVDLELENQIRGAIRRRGATLVLVSARAETLDTCDAVLRLACGEPAVLRSP